MSDSPPAAFFSYAHKDDERERGYLTNLRKALSDEVEAQTGEHFDIFQDRKDIHWGEQWRIRIEESLEAAEILIPILTPSYFRSSACRDEFEHFVQHEARVRRNDLILPIYYIDCSQMRGHDDPIAVEMGRRQYTDWRHLRAKSLGSEQVKRAIRTLASDIRRRLSEPPTIVTGTAADGGNRIDQRMLPEFLSTLGNMPAAVVEREYGPPFDVALLTQAPRFVGRESELQWVVARLASKQPAVMALNGMPGIGKTSLAAIAVERLHATGAFPDGIAVCLSGNLSDPIEIFRTILSRFDARRRVPLIESTTALPDFARTLLSGKRALAVLDSLAPGVDIAPVVMALHAAGISVLLTCQALLPTGVVPVNARLLLSPLTTDDAVQLLLSALAQPEVAEKRPPAEEAALVQIAEELGGHPLALELVAAYIADQGLDATAVAEDLRVTTYALELPSGEVPAVLSRAFESSVRALTADARRVFAVLAAFQVLEFGREAVLSVSRAIDLSNASSALNSLVVRALLRAELNADMPVGSDRQRLRLHPLLRAYAEQEFGLWSLDERNASHRAVAIQYVKYLTQMYAEAPDGTSGSAEAETKFQASMEASVASDAEAILRELRWIHSAEDSACAPELRDELVFGLCSGMHYYWRNRGLTEQLLECAPWGIAAAERIIAREADPVRRRYEASLLAVSYADALTWSGRLDEAEDVLNANLTIRQDLRDTRGCSAILYNLAHVAALRGETAAGIRYCDESLRLISDLDHPEEIVLVLIELARLAITQARYEDAMSFLDEGMRIASAHSLKRARLELRFQQARMLSLQRKLDEAERILRGIRDKEPRFRTTQVLCELGTVFRHREDLDKAHELYSEGLQIARERKSRVDEGIALHALAQVAIERQQLDQIEDYCSQSLELFRLRGDMPNMAMQLTSLAHVAVKRERWDSAEAFAQQSLAIARKVGNPGEQAVNLVSLARVAQARNQLIEARSFLEQGVSCFRAIGADDLAAKIQDQIRHLGVR